MTSKRITDEIEGIFYNDPPIPELSLKTIRILELPEVGDLWDRYISPDKRHFMLLGDLEWPAILVEASEPIYLWQDDWNANSITPLQKLMQEYQLPVDERIFVFWMREHAIETCWDTFCTHWINFLYEDEGCIVLFPNNRNAFVFSNGRAWHGARTAPGP